MTGLRNISVPVAVRYTSNHLCRRLLEDLGSHTPSGKSRYAVDDKLHAASGWNQWKNGRNGEHYIAEE